MTCADEISDKGRVELRITAARFESAPKPWTGWNVADALAEGPDDPLATYVGAEPIANSAAITTHNGRRPYAPPPARLGVDLHDRESGVF